MPLKWGGKTIPEDPSPTLSTTISQNPWKIDTYLSPRIVNDAVQILETVLMGKKSRIMDLTLLKNLLEIKCT